MFFPFDGFGEKICGRSYATQIFGSKSAQFESKWQANGELHYSIIHECRGAPPKHGKYKLHLYFLTGH